MSSPLASILVNNFNYGRFVGDAIESALAQTYAPLEVIVVDDGSSDGSAATIATLGDRITAIFEPQSRGQAAAINTAFRASRGEVIFLLDSDDEFKPEKVSRVMEVFAEHPGIGSCFHEVDRKRGGELLPRVPLSPAGEHDYRADIRGGRPPFIATPTVGDSFRRDTFEAILPMPEYSGIGVGDHYLKWTALLLANTYFLEESLAVQRLHERNAFTGRDDARARARIELANAHSLRQRFPESAKFSDRLFLQAITRLDKAERVDPEMSGLISGYSRLLDAPERWSLLLRGRVAQAKTRLRRIASTAAVR